MFEQATKIKLRFDSTSGLLGVEDLWDLNLSSGRVNLDMIAKQLNKQIKDTVEESFVSDNTRTDKVLKLKFDIVLHIIAEKKKEKAAAEVLAHNNTLRQNLLSLKAQKQNEELLGKSVEEIDSMLSELG